MELMMKCGTRNAECGTVPRAPFVIPHSAFLA